MGLSLLDFITGYDDLVVIDAVQTGQSPPGTVHELDFDSLKVLPAAGPHFVGLGEILALGRELSLPMPDRVKIFALEVADALTLGTQMTPPLQQAFPAIVQRVLTALRALQSEPPSA